MATIVKNVQKSGKISWKCKVRRKGFPTETRTFATRGEAAAWARAAESLLDSAPVLASGTATPADGARAPAVPAATLAAVLARYRDGVTPSRRGAAVETVRLNALIRSPIASLPMREISTPVLAAWRDGRLRKVKPGTVLREIGVLRAVLNRARAEWGFEELKCPFKNLVRPKQPEPRERRLSAQEEQRLYAGCRTAKNPYLRQSIEFALETGIRQGELTALTWSNVDLERRTIRLPVTKNGKTRTVPLSTRAVSILEALPQRSTGSVFCWDRAHMLKESFIRLTKRTNIEGLTYHDLRHEALSRMVERGLNLFEVAAVSGHSNMQQLKRYVHLRPEDIAQKLG
jgi:integrase